MTLPDFDRPIVLQGNTCFVSDAHLRTPDDAGSLRREAMLVDFLNEQKGHIQYLFLLGDIFDFWFEYHDVVPKGHYRFFNALYALHQTGTELLYFTGNHDMWLQDYFKEQFGCQVFYEQQFFILNGKRCLIGHGDGLGGRQRGYKILKAAFGFAPNRFLYSLLHPRIAFAIARACSRISRRAHHEDQAAFMKENETQVQYARKMLDIEDIDFFIYAHRHVPAKYELKNGVYFFNAGDWQDNFSYLVFNPEDGMPRLNCYKKEETTL